MDKAKYRIQKDSAGNYYIEKAIENENFDISDGPVTSIEWEFFRSLDIAKDDETAKMLFKYYLEEPKTVATYDVEGNEIK